GKGRWLERIGKAGFIIIGGALDHL
nr:Chain A, Pleurocidin-like prepropolypeptide [Pseudopleuronectes americanus]